MTEKICLDDWAPLLAKASTLAQLSSIIAALNSCFVEDRSIMRDEDWPLLRDLVEIALARVDRAQTRH